VYAQLQFTKYADFSQLPHDWKVSHAAVDWHGNPLLLIEEGKPPYPADDRSKDARIRWMNTPPKANHLVYWNEGSQSTLTFDKSAPLFISNIQPFGDGWLLDSYICDRVGRPQRPLDLGGGIADVQTTANGHIWVSYFDEGVFGNGVGQNGVVCFDSQGQPIFKYAEFAERNQLPFIADCYAMNVVSEEEVWLSYYTDFPLVAIRNFQLHRAWQDFECISGVFALCRETVIFPKCYTQREGKSQLLRRNLANSAQSEEVEVVDENGAAVDGLFTAAARGSNFYLLTRTALYKLQTKA
jgi:hypothetical protein